jgi:hypothetical protein
VPDGTSLLLVPVSVFFIGRPMIGGGVLAVEQAALLREDVTVQGGFYYLGVRVV